MADVITQCSKILDEGGNVVQYDFSYSIEDSGKSNSFCVVVLASEMSSPADEAEAKTKANTKASAIKSAWLSQNETTTSEVAAVVGDVTL